MPVASPIVAMKHPSVKVIVADHLIDVFCTARRQIPFFPLVPLLPLAVLLVNATAIVTIFRRLNRLEKRLAS
jgi:hypothetical protein